MNARNGSYKTLGMIFVLGMLVSGCGPSGDELFRQAQEAVKNNNEELRVLKGTRENFWKRYHKAKTKEKQTQILAEINDIQPKIKELYKYDKYCKEITKRAEGIQNNLNNFDKDIQKEKDNSRSM